MKKRFSVGYTIQSLHTVSCVIFVQVYINLLLHIINVGNAWVRMNKDISNSKWNTCFLYLTVLHKKHKGFSLVTVFLPE